MLRAARAWFACGLSVLLAGCGLEPRMTSVLLVTFDTTRADRLGCYGFEDAGTPFVDALAARGVRFERVYAAVPVTLPSHVTMMTGAYPPRHGVRDNVLFALDDRAETLAETFLRSGRRTAAFVSAVPLASTFGLAQGFQTYDDELDPPPQNAPRGEMLERRGERTIEAANAWLDTLDEGEAFFLWVHLFDPHIPLRAPSAYAERFPDDPYQAEIAYTDACFGELLFHLDELGRTLDTIVALTSDHGEGLGEHDEETHANLLYDGTMRVPLVLAGPGVAENRTIAATVGLVDLAPTLLELAGLDPGANAMLQGSSLVEHWRAPFRMRSHDVYFETYYPRIHHGWSELVGVARDGWKYVEAPSVPSTPGASGEASRGELFAVDADPRELTNLVSERTQVAEQLAKRLRELRAELAERALPSGVRTPSQEELDGFAKLGYAGGDTDATHALDASEPGPDPRRVVRAESMLDSIRALSQAGDFDRAARMLDALDTLGPGPVLLHEAAGDYYLARGRRGERTGFERAIVEFESALALRPGRRGIWLRLAEAAMAIEDYARALECVDRAMELSPPTPEQEAARRELVRLAEQAR